MSNYDFSTLNPTDFEKLVCDLLNKNADTNSYAKFRTSKEGKDKGIDILFSTANNDFEIVVQVKHYVKSTFSKLKSDLIKKEFSKVKNLNPRQYIFVTSLGLSVANKKEVMQIFSPYIQSLQDVLGRDDLNDLIKIHRDVEETHFKLWFSSVVALQKLLTYKFIGRNNEFSEEEIKKKLRLFVSTSELKQAVSILEHNKFLIITGEPGVGKTTLSEMIIYKYLSKDYNLTYIYDNIKDVEETLKEDDSKQIFYFDDFLGHTQAEIYRSKSAEVSLLKIIAKIEKADNKYLILNTRKFILSTFLEESERFKNFNPLRAENKIEIGAYSYGAKRRMLDNHIFECELNEEQKRILRDRAFYICTHTNFTPRHIDFYTSTIHTKHLDSAEFTVFITDNLLNPKKIWEHAYCNQISVYDNFLLNTLYSLGGNSSIELLEIGFNARLNFEAAHNNFTKPLNSFRNSLYNLNGGFIEVSTNRTPTEVSFINPSLEDFLHYWIGENNLEVERILFSAVNLDQWYYFFGPFFNSKHIVTENISSFFFKNYNLLLDKYFHDKDFYRSAMLLFSFDKDKYSELIVHNLKQIKSWDFIYFDEEVYAFSNKFIQAAKSNSKINSAISNFKLDFFVNTILSATHIIELMDIVILFHNHYGFSFRSTFENREDDVKFTSKVKEIKKLCKELINELINLQYGYLLDNREVDEHINVIEQIKDIKLFIRDYLFPKFKVSYKVLTQMDWNSLIANNITDELVFGEKYPYADVDLEAYHNDEFEEYYDYEKERIAGQLTQSSMIGPKNFENEHDDLPF